jgi:hypothetical protein
MASLRGGRSQTPARRFCDRAAFQLDESLPPWLALYSIVQLRLTERYATPYLTVHPDAQFFATD